MVMLAITLTQVIKAITPVNINESKSSATTSQQWKNIFESNYYSNCSIVLRKELGPDIFVMVLHFGETLQMDKCQDMDHLFMKMDLIVEADTLVTGRMDLSRVWGIVFQRFL